MSKANRGQREHWQTDVSDFDYLSFGSVELDSELTVSVWGSSSGRHQSFEFIWDSFCAYRLIDEAQFVPWEILPNDIEWHHTHKVIDSGWIAELGDGNEHLAMQYPKLQHFVVATDAFWIEILSENEPEISCVPGWFEIARPGTVQLIIPEPRLWYSPSDERGFYNQLNKLDDVSGLFTRPASGGNEIVLSLVFTYLTDASLRNLIGLMKRYQLPMHSLAGQCNEGNQHWFRNPIGYWYESVFGGDGR
ncbi:MAG TPA: hypothetical protein V6C81_06960 [Planktothrix sp.]|jgi:hypothetical protein